MEKRQLGLRITQALTDSIKLAANKERLSVNEYITRKLEDSVDNSIELTKRKELPEVAAIYIVTDELGQVLYIGQTTNLKQRWSSHNKLSELKKLGLVNINWFSCEEQQLLEVETVLIDLLKPQLNIHTGVKEKGAQFKVWLTEDEYKTLVAEAESYNISTTELIKVWIHKTYSAKTMLCPTPQQPS